jgi:transposase
MMDAINKDKTEAIKRLGYEYVSGLFSEKLNVIFYDCTTLYFESFEEDELKSNGYSKDNKFNQAQVLLSILVTASGLPISYELYEGNKYEGHTLVDALQCIHSKYDIDKIIFVADAGLLSKDNIEILRAHNENFIVGARIKNMSKELNKLILTKSNYKQLNNYTSEESLSYQEIYLENESLRLIVTYSDRRAMKDKHDREKAIESLQKRLSKSKELKSVINNYGYKKFLKIEGESTLTINDEKIAQAEAWDGLHGIITNIPANKLSVQEILQQYKGLWQVEETFRISKHDLRMRPVFHWKPRRIKAHIAICYMALVCIRIMEYKVGLQYKKMSPAAIRNELQQLQISILKDYKTGHKYAIPSKANQDGKKILQIFGKKWTDTPYMIT